jgi:hypothetical protein
LRRIKEWRERESVVVGVMREEETMINSEMGGRLGER